MIDSWMNLWNLCTNTQTFTLDLNKKNGCLCKTDLYKSLLSGLLGYLCIYFELGNSHESKHFYTDVQSIQSLLI